MVKIYCETIDEELREVARKICKRQKEDVSLITLTGIVEVYHEAEEAKSQENFEGNS